MIFPMRFNFASAILDLWKAEGETIREQEFAKIIGIKFEIKFCSIKVNLIKMVNVVSRIIYVIC